jgi:hypothetical protein
MMNNTTNYENNSKNATDTEIISIFYNGDISSIVVNDTTRRSL